MKINLSNSKKKIILFGCKDPFIHNKTNKVVYKQNKVRKNITFANYKYSYLRKKIKFSTVSNIKLNYQGKK